MKPFDLLHTPLNGTHLIEASAGTGKTYTIEALFLRLLLERRLSIDQILVVTFTKAATEELKDRIRRKIVAAIDAFDRSSHEDLFIRSLVAGYDHPELGKQILNAALFDFDQASIFTIHGFCQRLLIENAFETGCLFDTELVSNQRGWVREVSEDFWRSQFYHLPEEFIAYSTPIVKGPMFFARLFGKVNTPDTKITPEQEEPELTHLQPYRDQLKTVRGIWRTDKDDIITRLKDPALSGTTYGGTKAKRASPGTPRKDVSPRDLKTLALAEAMDIFVDSRSTGFPIFDGFKKLCLSTVEKAVRKNQVAPDHPIFRESEMLLELGKNLTNEMADYLLYLKYSFFTYATSELSIRKKAENIQFFDDLLLRVKQALSSGKGSGIAAGIRQKYKSALIDEFQDTDPIQNDIFTRIFSTDDSPLFLIGDPKQAIYSFRGADIFSYIRAAKAVDQGHTLIENWRSSPDLMIALNTVFSNVSQPFVFDEIDFSPAKPGRSDSHIHSQMDVDTHPFQIWFVDAQDGKPVNKADATTEIADAVAGEILHLISPPEAIGDSAAPGFYRAADIAVLVRTNRQSRIINAALSARRIPAVLCNAGNIFDSREAEEMERILFSIAEPGNGRLFRTAMATDIFGISATELDILQEEPAWWTSRMANFSSYSQIWNEKGFIRMFRLLMAKEGIRQRVLVLPAGERRMTNILQLVELLHQVSSDNQLEAAGLVKWLSEQRENRNDDSLDSEEYQLRLERDEQAVKIVTIHKSKGLEYSVVFCPFAWEGAQRNDKEISFHDPDDNNRLTLDLSPEKNGRHLALARKEELAENLRLLYVALTRARERCYLVWGHIRSADASGLSYLLPDIVASKDRTGNPDPVGNRGNGTADPRLQGVRRLIEASGDRIRVSALPSNGAAVHDKFTTRRDHLGQLVCRNYSGKAGTPWRINSYSSLVAGHFAAGEYPDHDGREMLFESSLDINDVSVQAEPSDDPLEREIFVFPGGAKAGIFFHDLLEHIDFTDSDSERVRDLLTTTLSAYGFEDKWSTTIQTMIQKVLATPLAKDKPRLVLSAIENKDRINEMEFYFPLKPFNPSVLRQLFLEHHCADIPADFPDRLGKLTFSPAGGFMKGYVDLIFLFEDKYYLLDWKSNILGSNVNDYSGERLMDVMTGELYILQYHVYTLALHQYLRVSKPDYAYARDFGGVIYMFIRGVDPALGPDFGIYADCPNPDLIDAMGSRMIPGYA